MNEVKKNSALGKTALFSVLFVVFNQDQIISP